MLPYMLIWVDHQHGLVDDTDPCKTFQSSFRSLNEKHWNLYSCSYRNSPLFLPFETILRLINSVHASFQILLAFTCVGLYAMALGYHWCHGALWWFIFNFLHLYANLVHCLFTTFHCCSLTCLPMLSLLAAFWFCQVERMNSNNF